MNIARDWGSVFVGRCVALGIAACGVLGAATGVGCGGSSKGSSPDLSALRTLYASPTGTLTGAEIKTVGDALTKEQSTDTSSIAVLSVKKSIDRVSGRIYVEDAPGANPYTCGPASSSGESCTCNGGGTFDEAFAASSDETSFEGTLAYHDCTTSYDDGTGDGETIDGTLNYAEYLDSSPAIIAYSGSLDITAAGTTVHEDLNYASIGGTLTYSVSVSSGNLLVQASGSWDGTTDTGTFTVIDHSATWQCTLSNGSGSCSSSTGATVTTS
jgi:hypothetical protein